MTRNVIAPPGGAAPSAELGGNAVTPKCGALKLGPGDVSEMLDLLARTLRPIYPLQADCGFDDLLRLADQADGER